ncbi:Adenosyl cobinamide kinase/adenosyl cobinamide phosphate guanylyltransferase [Lentibacillus persicus]|uniref:Adenosylcobinamide kinase n=1 Tax=Lentibacillus persicus TaxID=640948 RepID=A0A1I1S2Q2_9BACI|nr:bifunctional adenosylcobinamide kinase/adenosylcobinamide-phosphate guanylyltransferase [Lentibacillus persicus]SFD40779.1 Adenosyl cobinamide kinase/adenosyl cobinamide phosphate guanylyltransferase [Lentibacillus persicus]
MHFITGGAFNGKRKWVKNHYAQEHCLWLSAYDGNTLKKQCNEALPEVVVLEGLEEWVNIQIDPAILPDKQCREMMQEIEPWLAWEKADSRRRLVIIGTDISKGIVPANKEERMWRDMTGWLYQRLAAKAERVDLIWYGIEQTIKRERF